LGSTIRGDEGELGVIVADLTRRVRDLETVQRVATSSAQAATPQPDVIRPVAYDTTFRSTGIRVADSATVANPSLTVSFARALVIWSAKAQWFGTAGIYKGRRIEARILLDGDANVPWYWRSISDGIDYPEDAQIAVVMDATPGEHTLQVEWCVRAGAGSITEATLFAQSLFAIPVSLRAIT
jgi:hypothetical protein